MKLWLNARGGDYFRFALFLKGKSGISNIDADYKTAPMAHSL